MSGQIAIGADAPVVALHNVTLGYRRHPAVHHLDGAFRAGSMTAVIGPNGAGKSTLLKGIIGTVRPLSGRVELCGLKTRDVAYLPQQAEVDRSFPISVRDTVLLGHWSKAGVFGGIGRHRVAEAEAALEAVGLADFAGRPLGSLSAGQFQRVLFARMLLQDARLIILDEPFTAIDARTTVDLLQVIQRWHRERRTVVAVLHDFEQVHQNFPETLLLAREPVAWGATADVLCSENLRRANAMAEAWDDSAPACDRREVA